MSAVYLAGCVLFDEAGRALLVHRYSSDRTQWEIPGGKLEEGESAAEAAKRELCEELGVEVVITGLLGSCEFFENQQLMIYDWFSGIVRSGVPALVETGKFDDLRYFTWDELWSLRHQLSASAVRLVAACLRLTDSSLEIKK